MGIKVTVSDNKAIISAMQSEIDKLKGQIAAAIQGAGINTEAYAKQLCPVDTGRLRSSITYKSDGQYKCNIGTNVNYAAAVEFGHKTRGKTHVAARPYLFPGFARAVADLKSELNSL